MAREYKVFHGVGAVVVEVRSDTLVSVLAATTDGRVDFSIPARRFDVDLTLTPGRIGKQDWSRVKFDDRGINQCGLPLPAQIDCTQLRRGITTIGSGLLDDP